MVTDNDPRPAPTKRWVTRKKAEVVSAVVAGLFTLEEVLARFDLTYGEYHKWRRYLEKRGTAELLTSLKKCRKQSGAKRLPDERELSIGAYTLDREARKLTVGEVSVSFSPKECDLFALLFVNRGGLVTRNRILVALYDAPENEREEAIIDLFVFKVRNKLKTMPGGVNIVTVRGFGYRLIINERTHNRLSFR